jgi:hypothetical protein
MRFKEFLAKEDNGSQETGLFSQSEPFGVRKPSDGPPHAKHMSSIGGHRRGEGGGAQSMGAMMMKKKMKKKMKTT